MSAKFARLEKPGTGPILINCDHVRAAYQSAPNQMTLVMDPHHWQEKGMGFEVLVTGQFDEVWRELHTPGERAASRTLSDY